MDSYSINFDDSTGVFHLTSRYRSLSLKELLELRDPVSPSTSKYIAEFSKGKISAVPRQEKTTACQQSSLDRQHPGLYSRTILLMNLILLSNVSRIFLVLIPLSRRRNPQYSRSFKNRFQISKTSTTALSNLVQLRTTRRVFSRLTALSWS